MPGVSYAVAGDTAGLYDDIHQESSTLPAVFAFVGVLAFVASWNAYLLPLLVLSDPATFTLPLGVQSFSTQYSQDTAAILAFTSLAMLPALAFFTLAERQIVGGLQGAVKG